MRALAVSQTQSPAHVGFGTRRASEAHGGLFLVVARDLEEHIKGRRRATSVGLGKSFREGEALARYYSSFPMASFSLFMAITGGDDWWNLVRRRPCQKVPGPILPYPVLEPYPDRTCKSCRRAGSCKVE